MHFNMDTNTAKVSISYDANKDINVIKFKESVNRDAVEIARIFSVSASPRAVVLDGLIAHLDATSNHGMIKTRSTAVTARVIEILSL